MQEPGWDDGIVHLGSQRLEALFSEARQLTTSNHGRFLAELLETLTRSRDPIDALKLLRALWGSGFASREDERTALNAVGSWLELRLNREPGIDAAELAAEVGWLRRLSRFHARDQPGRQDRAAGGPGQRPVRRTPTNDGPTFARDVDALLRRRTQQLAARVGPLRESTPVSGQSDVTKPSSKTTSVQPLTLPAVLEVNFADVKAAREARKARRDREKAGKAPKESFVQLRPVDSRLMALAQGLCCSIQSEGLEQVFQAMDRAGGALKPFFVCQLGSRDGRLVAAWAGMSAPPAEH